MEERMKTIEERFWSKVDNSGECWTWTAARNADGYGRFCIDYKMEYAHRIAYALTNGPIADGMDVDHTCFNKSCVNPSHLREATRKQNTEHRQGAQSNSKSGIRGVTWHKGAGKWQANIKHDGKAIYLGTYATTAEAEAVVKAKRLELFTHSDQDLAA
jgi:hypothetical protein